MWIISLCITWNYGDRRLWLFWCWTKWAKQRQWLRGFFIIIFLYILFWVYLLLLSFVKSLCLITIPKDWWVLFQGKWCIFKYFSLLIFLVPWHFVEFENCVSWVLHNSKLEWCFHFFMEYFSFLFPSLWLSMFYPFGVCSIMLLLQNGISSVSLNFGICYFIKLQGQWRLLFICWRRWRNVIIHFHLVPSFVFIW